MLTKDEVEWIKGQCGLYRSFILQQLKIHDLCISHLELYAKLEQAEEEIDAWRNDALLMSDKRRAKKAEAELAELRRLVEGKDV